MLTRQWLEQHRHIAEASNKKPKWYVTGFLSSVAYLPLFSGCVSSRKLPWRQRLPGGSRDTLGQILCGRSSTLGLCPCSRSPSLARGLLLGSRAADVLQLIGFRLPVRFPLTTPDGQRGTQISGAISLRGVIVMQVDKVVGGVIQPCRECCVAAAATWRRRLLGLCTDEAAVRQRQLATSN